MKNPDHALSDARFPSYQVPASSIDPSAEPNPLAPHPTYEEISVRAYKLWQESAQAHDQHLDHWYEAERQLTEALAGGAPSPP